jgi:hypothetical protein
VSEWVSEWVWEREEKEGRERERVKRELIDDKPVELRVADGEKKCFNKPQWKKHAIGIQFDALKFQSCW